MYQRLPDQLITINPAIFFLLLLGISSFYFAVTAQFLEFLPYRCFRTLKRQKYIIKNTIEKFSKKSSSANKNINIFMKSMPIYKIYGSLIDESDKNIINYNNLDLSYEDDSEEEENEFIKSDETKQKLTRPHYFIP